MTSRPTDHIHVGMPALSADGTVLGTVCRLIVLDAYLFVELVPTAARWKVWTRPRHLFVPIVAVRDVLPDHLLLRMDARAARAYTARPEWTGQGTERATGGPAGAPVDWGGKAGSGGVGAAGGGDVGNGAADGGAVGGGMGSW